MANLQTHSSDDTPSTSTNPPKYYYDVFISHRGPDVKKTLASHLYHQLCLHGLQSFLDMEELQAAELLHTQIEGAIKTAYIHIVIFSQGYADSSWCLDELLDILNKSKDTTLNKSKDTVIPVFYNVKPSELRRTGTGKGRYAQALSEHKKKGRYDDQTLENWSQALNDMADISGYELEAYNGDEGKQLHDVVQCVLKKRRKIGLDVASHPTGLEEKLADFENFLSLQQQSGKVKVLGIVGMGGLGKTTLAKKIFNKKSTDFLASCFLFDVREKAGSKSLPILQKKLIKDLAGQDVQIDDVDEGIGKLKTYFLTSKPALIVLDDVDDVYQLEALFLPIKDLLPFDSLILVTSRYKDVLKSEMTEESMYKLTGLNDQHSEQLFCSYAFCQHHPPEGFKDVVDEFCRGCNGLPLSLKVFGGLLCGKKDKSYWKGLLEKLKLPKEIQQKLNLSYDALEEDEKQIFLDIACFFIGEDLDMAIRIWDGSGWKGLVGFLNLESRCLVEVDRENNSIKMHDNLRDLGREIVDQKVSYEGMPHRHWRLMDIHDLWQQYTVNTEVRGIRMVPGRADFTDLIDDDEISEFSWLKSWCDEVLGNCLRKLIDTTPYSFRKLQLVATEDGDLDSILRRVRSPNLIWLRWNKCPFSCLPSWIPMKNISVLEVVGKKLKTLWRADSQPYLELRELHIVAPLSKFPNSIGRLKHIEKIVVKRSNLKSLPEGFCHLRSLKHLGLNAYSLKSLPHNFGGLTNIQHLDLSGCQSLQDLPDSFGCLTNIQHLDLRWCGSLQALPDSFGCLTNIKHLCFSGCGSLQRLPDSFGCLTNLEHLNFLECGRLQGLPDSFGCLTNIQDLNLFRCVSMQSLPDSFGCLTNIDHLNLSKCQSLQRLPDSFGCLTNIQHLYLSWCGRMQRLPDCFGCLTNIQHLDLSMCGSLEGLPDSFGCLTNIQRLDLSACSSLRRLPESFGCLTNIQHLDLLWCSSLQGLPDSFGRLTNIRRLNLSGCTNLQDLPDSFGGLTNLEYLNVSGCTSLQEPHSDSSLGNLIGQLGQNYFR